MHTTALYCMQPKSYVFFIILVLFQMPEEVVEIKDFKLQSAIFEIGKSEAYSYDRNFDIEDIHL